MTIDKRMKYEMQGGSKPARNYLGTQKTVSGVPVKWKSGPDAPSTELAYITKAEKDLLLKKNLHGSLKNGPNTGPDGIMSLDSQGDYTRDRSPSRAEGSQAAGVGGGNSAYMNQQIQKAHDAQMKALLTGNVTKGETVAKGPRTRQYSDLPEYMKVGGKNKYIGSAYKSYGQPSFFGNLFSRGAPGYRGIKGLPAWGNPMKNINRSGTITPQGNIVGGEYYSDKENFGDTRDAVPFGIMGLIQSLANKFKKPPQDMSEFNKLTLDLDPNAKIQDQDTAFSKTLSDPFKYGVGPVPPSDKYKYSRGPQEVNVPDSPEGTSWDWMNNPVSNFIKSRGEDYYNLTQGENAAADNPDKWQLAKDIWPTYKQGLVDAGVGKWGEELQEDVSNKGWRDTISDRLMNTAGDDYSLRDATTWDIPFTDATIGDAFKGYNILGEKLGNRMNPIPEYTAEEQLLMGTLPDPFVNRFANGGLASLFTRRG